MWFSSLYFFFPVERTSALVLVEISLGAQKLCNESTGQDMFISLKTFNSTVQHNLCERLLKSSTLPSSTSQSQAAPLGFKETHALHCGCHNSYNSHIKLSRRNDAKGSQVPVVQFEVCSRRLP